MVPINRIGMEQRFLLRWRFDLPSGAKWGMWNHHGNHPNDFAWSVNKTGLIRASIEGKDIITRKIMTIAECDGHKFCNFAWNSALAMGRFKTGTGTGQIVGLCLVTNDFKTNVYIDGSTKVERRSEDEKKTHFASYGR